MSTSPTIDHSKLVNLLQKANSAEKAAIKQIEMDEWHHREVELSIMQPYRIQPSRYNEIKYHIIGRVLSASCHVIGWFMPYFFAGRLESGNVSAGAAGTVPTTWTWRTRLPSRSTKGSKKV